MDVTDRLASVIAEMKSSAREDHPSENGASQNARPASGAPANGAAENGAAASRAPENGAAEVGVAEDGAHENGAHGTRNDAAPLNEQPSFGHFDKIPAEWAAYMGLCDSRAPAAKPEDRIQELIVQSSRLSDPLEAVTSSAGGDLQLLQRVMLQAVTQFIQSDPDPMEAIGDAEKYISLALKTGSQGLQFLAFAEKHKRQRGVPLPSE